MYRIAVLTAALLVSACAGERPQQGDAPGGADPENAHRPEGATVSNEPSSVDEGSSERSASPEVSNEESDFSRAQILVRASIDIRGRRPSRAELDQLASAPARLDAMIESFLDDPGFGVSVADLFARAFRNRSDQYNGPDDESLADWQHTYQQSVADESLMLLRHIVDNDLSYDEFLQADYTFANADFAGPWRMVGYDTAEGGWQRVRYGDGRPAAGYLAMSSVFMRYPNDDLNFNRGRANAMSRILLCDDFLKRPVLFPRDLDLSDDQAIQNAISTNVACTSCHDQLDPLASFFSVYTSPELEVGEIRERYSPENADEWVDTTGKRPSFYGRDGEDLADLARFIREDPRYARCAVQRVYEGLLDRAAGRADSDAITRHLRAFEAGGRTFHSLYLSVMSDPVYRGGARDERPALDAKMLSPENLQRVVTHVTGFYPTINGVDIMRAGGEGEASGEAGGLRILGGGLSAFSGDYPSRTANVTRVLVQGRLAEAAALYVVDDGGQHLEDLVVDLAEPPYRAGVERLFYGILGRPPTDQEVDEFQNLYDDLIDDGASADIAHAGLISALLRDPEFVIY